MKILVSDMGGVLYSYHPSFDPVKHEEEFNKEIEKLVKDKENIKEVLRGEWEAINSGALKVYPNNDGIKNFVKNLKIYHCVVVSTSLVKTSRFILEKFSIPLENIDIFDISDYGSKKESEAWKKIFVKLPSVDVIVEDNEKNLNAALKAATELGYNPKIYQTMPLLL